VVPGKQLKSLGIEPKTLDVALADGSIVTRKVGDAYLEYRGRVTSATLIGTLESRIDRGRRGALDTSE